MTEASIIARSTSKAAKHWLALVKAKTTAQLKRDVRAMRRAAKGRAG